MNSPFIDEEEWRTVARAAGRNAVIGGSLIGIGNNARQWSASVAKNKEKKKQKQKQKQIALYLQH